MCCQYVGNTRNYIYTLPGEPKTGVSSKQKIIHWRYSLSKESRKGIVSRLEIQQGTIATHNLKSQGNGLSTGFNHGQVLQALTFWRIQRSIISKLEEQ